MNDFLKWYNKMNEEHGGLTSPATAAKLIGISNQHLNRIISLPSGRIRKYHYQDIPFIGMDDIIHEAKAREFKEKLQKAIESKYYEPEPEIPTIFPWHMIGKWNQEMTELGLNDKWGGITKNELFEFYQKKYVEWRNANQEEAKRLDMQIRKNTEIEEN